MEALQPAGLFHGFPFPAIDLDAVGLQPAEHPGGEGLLVAQAGAQLFRELGFDDHAIRLRFDKLECSVDLRKIRIQLGDAVKARVQCGIGGGDELHLPEDGVLIEQFRVAVQGLEITPDGRGPEQVVRILDKGTGLASAVQVGGPEGNGLFAVKDADLPKLPFSMPVATPGCLGNDIEAVAFAIDHGKADIRWPAFPVWSARCGCGGRASCTR